LFELSPSEEKVTRAIRPKTQGYVTLAMNPNGKSLYMSEAKQVEVFDLAENKVVKKILSPSTVESILRGAVTPDGKYLYLPAGFTETVVMIDLVTNKYVESFQAGSEPTAVAIAPNGKYAYVADGSEDASAVTVVDISEQ
jgi:DNA-binding beta-propeller fold protein YncE